MAGEIIRGLSYDDYARLDALRFSHAKHFARSPMHARFEMTHEPDDTTATLMGHALHSLVLEPERFRSDYAVGPIVDKRTKAGKEAWAAFEAANPTAIRLRGFEYEQIVGMAKAIREHPFMQVVLASPKKHTELTLVWTEEIQGVKVKCKCRLDLVVVIDNVTYIIDLKSCTDARPHDFGRKIETYNYYGQAACYMRGLNACKPSSAARRWLWVAVESTAPYGLKIYEPTEQLLADGTGEFLSYAYQYALAVKANAWPGYSTVIEPIDRPRWAWNKEEVA